MASEYIDRSVTLPCPAQNGPSEYLDRTGYTRIQGALANLGHQVGRGTIANILKDNGIDPAPQRDGHTRWSTFLNAHWECLTATDFLSVEVFTFKGLITYYFLFFIDIASRKVHVAGITPHPDNAWRHRSRAMSPIPIMAFSGTRGTSFWIATQNTRTHSEGLCRLDRERVYLAYPQRCWRNVGVRTSRYLNSVIEQEPSCN
jgi:hypothetical protein